MEFKEFQLKDLLDIQWGDTNTTKSSYIDEGYLAYSASGPDGFLDHFDYDADGVVLSAIGANCGTTYMAKGKWSCIKNTIRFLPKNNQIDIKYFYYLSKRSNFFPLRGSAQPFISQTDIRDLYVDIPEVKYQQFIGKILDEIEQKINVNNQISQTLESIAQSIFKSWFIDFDPVHAKSRGEKPIGMDDETAALFPDSFEDSELGMIPKGWSVDPASSLFDFSIGRTPPRKESSWFCSPGLGHTWVSIKDLGTYGVFTQASAENLTAEAIKRHRVPIVPTGTVLMSFKLTLGRIAITSEPLATNEAIAHFIPKEKDSLSSEYTYLFLKNFDYGNLDNTSSIANATNSSQVKNISFLFPSDLILEAFQKRVKPIFIQIDILTRQNRSLEKLRDSLLPRLISGELQIPEDLLVL